MRVSERLIFETFTNHILANRARMLELQEQLGTGKKVNRPSDNPIDYGKALNFRNLLTNAEQFIRNIRQGISFLKQGDSTLGDVGNLLVRAKEVALSMATATASSQDRVNAAQEIRAIFNQLVQFANTRVGDRYIFGGFQTDTASFGSTGTYLGDSGNIRVEIQSNVTIAINTPGDVIFNGSSGGVNLFTILSTLQTDLQTNNVSGIDTALNNLDTAINQVLTHRADFGARAKRIESTELALEDFKLNVTRLISEAEDADLAKVASDLALQQGSLEGLRTSARLLVGESLMNFLR